MHRILLFLLILFWSADLPGAARTFVMDASSNKVSIGQDLEYMREPVQGLRVQDLLRYPKQFRWKLNKSDIINFGMTKATYWIRFKVKTFDPIITPHLIELDRNQFDELEIYSVNRGAIEKLDITPVSTMFTEQYMKFSQTIVPIYQSRGSGVTTYYIKAKMSNFPFYLPISIWKTQSFWLKQSLWVALHGLFYGSIAVIILYNLFIFSSIREKSYLFYIMYMFFFTFLLSVLEGVGYSLFWTEHSWFHSRSVPFAIGLCGFFIGLFTSSFLPTKVLAPRLHRIIQQLILFGFFLSSTCFLFNQSHIFLVVSAIYGSLGYCVLLLVSVVIVIRGFKPGIIFLAAYLTNIISVFAHASMAFGILEPNLFTIYGMHGGAVIQAVVFSIALTAKMKHLQNKARARIEKLNSQLEKEVRYQTKELRSQKEQIEKANKELREIDSQKTSFFQNISHELRTPLTLILMPLETMLEQNSHNKPAKIAYKNAQRLYRLVNQLLDFQKIDARKFQIKDSAVEVIKFVQTCTDYFSSYSSSSNKQVHIAVMVDGEIQDIDRSDQAFYIIGDIDALEKVMFNLLSNAMKYSKDQDTIEIGITTNEKGIRIHVKDQGPGITQDGQKGLFEVFSQVDHSCSRFYEGTGIGLALSKALVEQMGGMIGVESEVNHGACFWFTFPQITRPKPVYDLVVIAKEQSLQDLFKEQSSKSYENFTKVWFKSFDEADATNLFRNQECRVLVIDLQEYIQRKDRIQEIIRGWPLTYKILTSTDEHKKYIARMDDTLPINKIYHRDDPRLLSKIPEMINQSSILGISEASFQVKSWLLADIQNGDTSASESEDRPIEKIENRHSVLLADDSADMRDLVSNLLKKRGFKVITADDGQIAYEKATSLLPDLIVTDWMMPRLSGIELVHKIKQHPIANSIPMILLTAKSEENSKATSLEAGAVAYLGKPFNEAELIGTVRNMISMREQEKKISELNKHINENILSRYLCPSLVEEITSGKRHCDFKPADKSITVIFTDIKDFTRHSEMLGSDKISTLLNEYLDHMIQIVFDFGGTIDKIIGDALMVFFGAPNEMEKSEQANSACLCALAMQEGLKNLNERWNEDFATEISVRIGIHFGDAMVGNFGNKQRSDYTAVGHTINIASRIESVCTPSEVFISREVAELVSDVEVIEAGAFNLKGIGHNIQLFQLIQPKKAS